MEEVTELVKASLDAFYANPPYRNIGYLKKALHDREVELKRQQITNKVRFPPLPTEDEVLKIIFDLDRRAAVVNAKLRPISPDLKALQSLYIDTSLALHVEGYKRPLVACLHSRFFSLSPAQKAVTAELMDGRIKSKDGTKEMKNNYEYAFARHWLVYVKKVPPYSAISLVAEKIFHTSESTIYRQINELDGTEEGKLIQSVLECATAYPEIQEKLLKLYCQNLHVFLTGK